MSEALEESTVGSSAGVEPESGGGESVTGVAGVGGGGTAGTIGWAEGGLDVGEEEIKGVRTVGSAEAVAGCVGSIFCAWLIRSINTKT